MIEYGLTSQWIIKILEVLNTMRQLMKQPSLSLSLFTSTTIMEVSVAGDGVPSNQISLDQHLIPVLVIVQVLVTKLKLLVSISVSVLSRSPFMITTRQAPIY